MAQERLIKLDEARFRLDAARARTKLRVPQTKLAKLIGCSHQSLNFMERGWRPYENGKVYRAGISLQWAKPWAQALGLDINEYYCYNKVGDNPTF